MYHARFKGSHYECGYNYGKILKNHGIKIDSCPTFPITKNRIEFGKKCLKIYKEIYPEVIEEIKGFAEGNETSFEFLSTLLLTMYCFNADNKCSCFAFKNKDNIIFGRNSDFLVNIEKLYMNVLHKLDNVYAFNGNTTAFIEIEDGINEYGLSIGLTFIASKEIKPGLNIGMLIRYILEKCKTVKEALQFLKSVPIASTGTLTMIDNNGEMAVVECSPREIKIIKEENNYVKATNIFVSDELKDLNLKDFDNWRALDRYKTIETAFNNNEEKDLLFSKNLLSGKYGFMCQYDRKTNADTVWSVIYDVKNKKIYRVEGNPSRKEFKEDNRMKFK